MERTIKLLNIYPVGWFLLAGIATSALAADTVRFLSGDNRFWVSMLAVQVLTSIGYAASSLIQWAGWQDGDLSTRLGIVQGAFTALLAGNIAYYGGYYYFVLPEVGCFIASAVAAWGGDKFLSPLLSRITGKIGDDK